MKIMYVHKKLRDGEIFTNDIGIYDAHLYHQGLNDSSISVDFFPHFSKKKILLQNMSSMANHYDIVHSSGYYVPIIKNKPLIATLPDAAPCLFSSEKFAFALKRFLKHHVKYADHFIATNPAVIPELSNHWKIKENRISIIPPGLDPIWFNVINEKATLNTLEKYRIKPGFFLIAGQIDPRKNLLPMIEAFHQLPENIKNKHHLVVIGNVLFDDHNKIGLHLELASNFKNIHWIRSASLNDLQAFFQNALGYFHLANFEHFHFHLLSAYASNIPVISMNNEYSLPYTKNQSYLLAKVNPQTIRQAMLDLANEPNLCGAYIDSAHQFAKQFSWKITLEKTIELFKKLL